MSAYPVATGVAVLDRETGSEFGFCHPHLEAWQADMPDMFGTRLVVIGPVFGTGWACPVCG